MSIKEFTVVTISIFNHWLSETEALQCKVMSYDIALDNNSYSEYLMGERNYVNLYQSISDSVICNYRKNGIAINTNSETFKSYIIDGLRKEDFHILYPSENIRVIGGYDRTDTIILNNDENKLSFLWKLIETNNLFVLNTTFMNKLELLEFLE